jgi:hypothetical protein
VPSIGYIGRENVAVMVTEIHCDNDAEETGNFWH